MSKCTCETLWGGLHHLDCPVVVAAQQTAAELRARDEAEQHARDEALRQEGRLQEREAVVAMLQERASHYADRPGDYALCDAGAETALREACEAIEQGEHLKEGT